MVLTTDFADGTDFTFFIRVIRVIRGSPVLVPTISRGAHS